MTDPAVEAAKQVRAEHHFCVGDRHTDSCLTDAAREALKPLRKLHYSHEVPSDEWICCPHCAMTWPCDTARHIYPEDELT